MLSDIDGRPLVPEVRSKYGHIQTPSFTIDGDLEQAYEFLKSEFDSKPNNKSGPIKPLTSEEKLQESNRHIERFLKDT